jgi:hypothetical protein
MSALDFSIGILLAVATGGFMYLGWYYCAVFTAMMFLLVMTSMVIFHMRQPQPRWVLGATAVDSEEELEEFMKEMDNEEDDVN